MTQSPTQKAWFDAFKPACRSRRMRFVSETGFVVDDVYLAELDVDATPLSALKHSAHDGDLDGFRITWTVAIKPLAVDDVLWTAFLPDVEMGQQMRINRRINGAFTISPPP